MKNFLKGLHWKILCLVVAFVFWLLWTSEESIVQFPNVPVKLQNLSTNLDISGNYTNFVNLNVKGPGQVLNKMQATDMDVKVDLSGYKPGSYNIPLNSENVKLPLGTQLEKISPPFLVMTIEKKERKLVPVIPEIQGTPAEGYELDGYDVSPNIVFVEGPESKIKPIENAVTESISIEGRTDSFTSSVNVFVDNEDVRIGNDLKKVTVDVKIKEEDIVKKIEDVPLNLRSQKYKTQINPDALDVVLKGPPSLLERIGRQDLGVYVDLSGLEPRSRDYLVGPTLKLTDSDARDNVQLVTFSQKKVNVKIYNQLEEGSAN